MADIIEVDVVVDDVVDQPVIEVSDGGASTSTSNPIVSPFNANTFIYFKPNGGIQISVNAVDFVNIDP